MIISMISGMGSSYVNCTCYSGRGAGGGIKIPAVPKMRTKGQCKLSEKQLVERIVKLAQKDAAAGKNSQYGAKVNGIREGTAEWKKLREDFISLSSPNREGIIKNTLSNLAGKMSSMQLKTNGRLSFFSLIFNNSKKFGSDVKINLISFRDEQGNEVAHYSPNGWHQIPTPAESARLTTFYALWKQALADAQEDLEWESKGEIDILA